MEHQSWDFTAIYYEAIDHFCHAFMPLAPPKLPSVDEKQYEIYKDVISGAYRFHDMMLGRLLSLAGENTYVILCSDHGFLSGGYRPKFTPREPAGPAYWHRQLGILAIQGPGIRRDSLVFGASLLDITPTILTMFGFQQLERQLTLHRNQVLRWLRKVEHMELLEVDYPSLVCDSKEQIRRVEEFLGADRLPSAAAMPAVVRPELHRQQQSDQRRDG